MEDKIITKIKSLILAENTPDVEMYRDLYYLAKEKSEEDKDNIKALIWLSDRINSNISRKKGNIKQQYYLHYDVLKTLSPVDFESYMLFMEWNRDIEKQFYRPRKKSLKIVVDSLQELDDGDLDLLGVSMPPASGKTTLALFYLTWLAGKYPNKPCLTGSHSNSFVRGCYDECLRIMSPHGEYQWNEVFPSMQIVRTNANDCQIDVDTAKRFASLQFTSIGSGNAGKYRAERLLYADDLVSGSEVALSKERLDKLWGIYTTDLRQRMQGDCCKQLVIATRWSVHDVLGRLEQEYAGSDKARFIVIPALDENGESNFDYPFNLGFTTAMYNEQKAIMDDIMWRALFMNQPIEREGLIFAENELRRYFELPKGEDGKVLEPDAIISVCDTKDKGEDFCVMPIAYVYGDDYYIEDCVCDNGMPSVVDAKLVDILLRHKVAMSRFESNSAGRRTAEEIQRQVKQLKGNTHITTKYTTANKITKIITESKWILDHCLFKENTCFDRNSDYGKFMNMLTSFTQIGKNKHDDVPDAMAQLSQFARSMCQSEVRIIDRPF